MGQEISRDMYFDTDCMALINSRWHLDKKSITITAPTMYFEKNVKLTLLSQRAISAEKLNGNIRLIRH